jgi:hypothetical protein
VPEARDEEREHVEEGGLLRDAEDGLERRGELVAARRERGKVVAEAGEPDDVERAVREIRLDVDLGRGRGAELRVQDVPQLFQALRVGRVGLSARRTSFALSSMIPVSSRICTAPNAGFSAVRWIRCVSPSATSTPAPIICVSMRRDAGGFSYTSVVCRRAHVRDEHARALPRLQRARAGRRAYVADVEQRHDAPVLRAQAREELARLADAHVPEEPVRAVRARRDAREVCRQPDARVRCVGREREERADGQEEGLCLAHMYDRRDRSDVAVLHAGGRRAR